MSHLKITVFFISLFIVFLPNHNATLAAQSISREKCDIEGALSITNQQPKCPENPYQNNINALKAASPENDADAQAKAGIFKFIQITNVWGGPTLPGTQCFIDWPKEEIHGDLFFSDYISQGQGVWRTWASDYVKRFNQATINHPLFPYKDVCVPYEVVIQKNKIKKTDHARTLEDWIAKASTLKSDGSLLSASRLGKREEVISLLQSGNVDVNIRDIFNFTALEWSLLQSDTELVKTLIKSKVAVNGVQDRTSTPLYLAIALKNAKHVQLLLEAGANPNKSTNHVPFLAYPKNSILYSNPLTLAAIYNVPEIAKLLLNAGANVNGQEGREPPIFAAIENHYTELFKILLDAGADITLRDRNGISPIQTAVERKNFTAMELLMQRNAGHLARSDYEELLWKKAHKAGHKEILAHLIAFGPNLNLATRSERRRISKSVSQNDSAALEAALKIVNQRADDVKAAILHGDLNFIKKIYRGDVKPIRNFAYSELAIALQAKQLEISRWFLNKGANPNADIVPSNMVWLRSDATLGENSIDSSITAENRKSQTTLIKDENNTFLKGKTYALAFQYGPLALTKLVAKKSTIKTIPQENKLVIPLSRALSGYRNHNDIALLDYALKFDAIEPTSARADFFLSRLCSNTMIKNLDALNHYINLGFLPHQTAPQRNPRDKYIKNDYALDECLKRNADAAIILLENGASPNQRGRFGTPPLHAAIQEAVTFNGQSQYVKLIELLLKKGADPAAIHEGNNAYDVAQHRLRFSRKPSSDKILEEVITLLAEYGVTTSARQQGKGAPQQYPDDIDDVIPISPPQK